MCRCFVKGQKHVAQQLPARQHFTLPDHVHAKDTRSHVPCVQWQEWEKEEAADGRIKRAIMDGIGQRFTLRGSGITADQNCSLSVSFRLMTDIWAGPKVLSAFHRLNVEHVCVRVSSKEKRGKRVFTVRDQTRYWRNQTSWAQCRKSRYCLLHWCRRKLTENRQFECL